MDINLVLAEAARILHVAERSPAEVVISGGSGAAAILAALRQNSGAENIGTASGETLAAMLLQLQFADGIDYSPGFLGGVQRTVAQKLGDIVDARDFGVKATGLVDDTTALQAAVTYIKDNPLDQLILPPGEMLLSDNITLDTHSSTGSNYFGSFTLTGAGSGVNGSYLHFTNGSLIVQASGHRLSNMRVRSDSGDGIIIRPSTTSGTKYPVRAGMENVRAEYCVGSGITIEDCWVYLMVNVYARFNSEWGIEGKAGANFSTACNGWTILGGEFQGNGTRQGTATGPQLTGGTLRGTGGGIYTGRCVNFRCVGSSIEGNRGDGLKFGNQVRAATVQNVYFEKNGTHHENRDICNDQPTNPGTGLPDMVYASNSFRLSQCNFTPQAENGTEQQRAIELWDVKDLMIKQMQFAAGGASGIYSEEPVWVRETVSNRSTGWMEGGYYGSTDYVKEMLKNSTTRYGRPTKHVFSPNKDFDPATDQATNKTDRYVVSVPPHAGTQIQIEMLTRPNGATGTAKMVTTARRGPSGTTVGIDTDIITYTSSIEMVKTTNTADYSAAPWGHVEVEVARDGDAASPDDTLAVTNKLMSLEITFYQGHIKSGG